MSTPVSSTPASTQAPSAPAAPAQPASNALADKPAAAPAAAPETAAQPAAKPPLSEGERRAIVEATKAKREAAELRKSNEAGAKAIEILNRIKDPQKKWEAASELGLTYEEHTQYVLGSIGKKQPEAAPLELPPEVVEKLKLVDEIEAERKTTKEAAAAAEQKRVYDEKVETVKGYVERNAETMPITLALGSHEDMLRAFLAETQANDGVPPDDQDFAARYEKRLADTVEKQLTAIAASSKGKALLQRLLGVESATPANPKQPDPKAAPKTRAITNGLSAEAPPAADPRKLPPAELQKRAARHFSS